nr:unnamed protein product [Digitaria exilis]
MGVRGEDNIHERDEKFRFPLDDGVGWKPGRPKIVDVCSPSDDSLKGSACPRWPEERNGISDVINVS